MISKITENSRLLAKHTIIYLFKIDQRTRMNVERASNELMSDNISHREHDPESDAKWARFKLRVSQQRQIKHIVPDAFVETYSQFFH